MEKPNNIGYIILESSVQVEDSRIVSQKSNRVIAEGTLQDLNTKNRNQRTYDNEMKNQITCPRTKELLDSGNMKGENGHPSSSDILRQSTIDPMKVCVKYLKFWADGDKIKAQFKGTNNSLGESFNDDLIDGELPSFSLRALGSIENRNGEAYVRNVKMVTYDRVIYPSHKVAYTEKILSEATSGIQAPTIESVNDTGILIPIVNKQIIDYIKCESANLKTIIENFDTCANSIIPITENGMKYIQLTNSDGSIMMVKMENYIRNEIMNYCYKG